MSFNNNQFSPNAPQTAQRGPGGPSKGSVPPKGQNPIDPSNMGTTTNERGLSKVCLYCLTNPHTTFFKDLTNTLDRTQRPLPKQPPPRAKARAKRKSGSRST